MCLVSETICLVSLAYVDERFRLPAHDICECADLTACGVGGAKPLLQAAKVEHPDGAGAVARRHQLLPVVALVADTAEHRVAEVAASRLENL